MDSERWQRLKLLFQAALGREPTERALWLDRECDGDSELRAEIEALLAADGQPGEFLESPADATARSGGGLSAGARQRAR